MATATYNLTRAMVPPVLPGHCAHSRRLCQGLVDERVDVAVTRNGFVDLVELCRGRGHAHFCGLPDNSRWRAARRRRRGMGWVEKPKHELSVTSI